MKIPKYYNHHTSAPGIAICGLAHLGSEYYDFVIGSETRKSISKIKTYRVRTGNGHYGSILGQLYQDVMDYKVVTDPKTDEQQANRDKFRQAEAGAMALTEEERDPYKLRAKKITRVTWFNVFVSDFMTA